MVTLWQNNTAKKTLKHLNKVIVIYTLQVCYYSYYTTMTKDIK